ncbi:hypothetical protein CLOM_g773 [Closterium sp. NIES-68]|nr:hypothetical protein CLOM_g773 [Closterium sp. NIES-68]
MYPPSLPPSFLPSLPLHPWLPPTPSLATYPAGITQERVEANVYESLTINYIHGKVPDLVLFDSHDREVARVDVSPKSFDEIEKLVQSMGFKRKRVLPPLEDDDDVAIK